MSKYEEKLIADDFIICYDDPAPSDNSAPSDDPVPSDTAPSNDPTLAPEMQELINKKIAEATKQHSQKAQKAFAELDALKRRGDLTQAQRDDLEKRVETIQNELMTKEQRFEQEKKKKEKQYTEQVDGLTKERDTWMTRYTDSTITRAITDASAKNEAFDSDTIVALLKPTTKLMETLDNDGQPTGDFEAKVNFIDPEGKDGKPVKMLLSVPDAVKRMSELDKYQYLFKGRATGGTGRGNTGGSKPMDLKEVAKDPEAYRKGRKEGKIQL